MLQLPINYGRRTKQTGDDSREPYEGRTFVLLSRYRCCGGRANVIALRHALQRIERDEDSIRGFLLARVCRYIHPTIVFRHRLPSRRLRSKAMLTALTLRSARRLKGK